MVNYKLTFSMADAVRIFQVDSKAIKDWIYYFSEHLGKNATPIKGVCRTFEIADIRVMAFIYSYWEENPDIEAINMGLNTNGHYDNEPIDNLIIRLTPFFIEPPENIDETWKHGVVFGGLSDFADTFFLANSYKIAGDKLIDIALKDEEGYSLFCPAIYN
jgi:hypothetical protein